MDRWKRKTISQSNLCDRKSDHGNHDGGYCDAPADLAVTRLPTICHAASLRHLISTVNRNNCVFKIVGFLEIFLNDLRLNDAERHKYMFVAAKTCLSRQNTSFVSTKKRLSSLLSGQNYVCCDKNAFSLTYIPQQVISNSGSSFQVSLLMLF